MATGTDSVDLVDASVVRPFARAALLAALTAALAYVAFPNPWATAPVTLQVLGVFLVGLYLTPQWAAVSMILYLAAGAVGAPVFAGGSAGIGVLQGPNAGFLWSFPVAAALIGTLVHRNRTPTNPADRSLPVLAGALVAATVVIYAAAVLWLMWLLELGPVEAALVGALPFIPFELLKAVVAIAIVRSDVIDPT